MIPKVKNTESVCWDVHTEINNESEAKIIDITIPSPKMA